MELGSNQADFRTLSKETNIYDLHTELWLRDMIGIKHFLKVLNINASILIFF